VESGLFCLQEPNPIVGVDGYYGYYWTWVMT